MAQGQYPCAIINIKNKEEDVRMSTKKLQIVTPIVTSVNGKTGDVTTSPFVDWTPQYNKMLENGGDAAQSSKYWGFMVNSDGTYLMDDGMYYINMDENNLNQTEYLTIQTYTCNSVTVRMVIREYVTDDPFWCKEIWIKPLSAADATLAAYFSSEENLIQTDGNAVSLPVVSTRDNGKILKVVNGNWKAVIP
jgi:hypothetical protein